MQVQPVVKVLLNVHNRRCAISFACQLQVDPTSEGSAREQSVRAREMQVSDSGELLVVASTFVAV